MPTENPYASPTSDLKQEGQRRYVGFWMRFLASIIDSILLMIVILPLLYAFYGSEAYESEKLVQGTADVLISYVLPFVLYIGLWVKYGGTPGKRILGFKIVSRDTGEHLSIGAGIIRYIGYIVSTIPLFLGFIWVAFQSEKRGWHDLMAGSVVIYD